jgi:ATP-dependent Clp protease ATP-binding subunit ClpC
MYERYIEEARRAVFYARAVTMLSGAPAIDSTHLLSGVMWQEDSRAQTLFKLREIFPLYIGCPHKSVDIEQIKVVEGPQLTDDSKKILARAGIEADAMRDCWIGTEHLFLGILAEPNCTAARNLAKAGITLKSARRVVSENRSSRAPNGPIVRPGESPSPLELLIFKWRKWKYKARG